jgi:hypothetical protein
LYIFVDIRFDYCSSDVFFAFQVCLAASTLPAVWSSRSDVSSTPLATDCWHHRAAGKWGSSASDRSMICDYQVRINYDISYSMSMYKYVYINVYNIWYFIISLIYIILQCLWTGMFWDGLWGFRTTLSIPFTLCMLHAADDLGLQHGPRLLPITRFKRPADRRRWTGATLVYIYSILC